MAARAALEMQSRLSSRREQKCEATLPANQEPLLRYSVLIRGRRAKPVTDQARNRRRFFCCEDHKRKLALYHISRHLGQEFFNLQEGLDTNRTCGEAAERSEGC